MKLSIRPPRGSQQQSAATSALWLVAICSCFVMGPARADESVELAKKLANPVANLISVPIKLDWDTGIGSNDADQYNFVIQPVIPFSLNSDWSLISRTIAPFIEAKAPPARAEAFERFECQTLAIRQVQRGRHGNLGQQ
jgi:hypothetical protein